MHINLTLLLAMFCLIFNSLIAQDFDGYCLYNAINNRNAYAIDQNGDIAHTWSCPEAANYAVALKENGNLVRGFIYSGNQISGAAVGGGVHELDRNGLEIWRFIYSSSTYVQHHDISLMPNGNVLLTAWETKTNAELAAQGYTGTSTLWPTHFVEVAQNGTGGEIVWEWHMFDHFVQEVDTNMPNYGVVSEHPEKMNINVPFTGGRRGGDWFHVNGVNYNPETDLITFSSRYVSEIFVIDHSTTTEEAKGSTGGNFNMGGDILYRWGNPANYNTTGTRWIPGPCHDARFIPNDGRKNGGFIQFFNNDGSDNLGSTVNAIELPLTGNEFFREDGMAFGPEEPTFTHHALDNADGQSASNTMPNGNTFVCLSGDYLYEVDSLDNLIWQYSARTSKAFRYTCDYPGIIELLDNPCEIISSTSVLDNAPATIYPNPSSGSFVIQGKDYDVNVREITVVDMTGRVVEVVNNSNQLDLSGYDNGVYSARIKFSNAPTMIQKISLIK